MNRTDCKMPEDGYHQVSFQPVRCLVTAFDIREIDSKVSCEKLLNCLSEDRRKKADAYLFPDDKRRCAVGQLLAEYTLQRLCGNWIDRSRFKRTETGKPVIEGSDELFFNISHSGNWVCCAAANVPVGIDVEKISDIDRGLYLMCLTEEEQKEIEAIGNTCSKDQKVPSRQAEHFIQIWTMKEAYLKMTGEGLRRPMDTFRIKKNDAYWTVDAASEDTENSSTDDTSAMIFSKEWDEGYYISVCAGFHNHEWSAFRTECNLLSGFLRISVKDLIS